MFTLVIIVFLACFAAATDFYKILDLHKSASDKDIRHAYRKLSKKFHPDKNKEKGAEDKFVQIAHGFKHMKSFQTRKNVKYTTDMARKV